MRLLKNLTVLLLLLLAGCQNPPEATQPPPALSPTHTPDLTPRPSDVRLNYPEEIAIGETMFVVVINQGNLNYAFVRPEGDNCLPVHPQNAREQYFPINYELACDVLTFNIVRPGERREFGNWDLTVCEDMTCSQRTPALPGFYSTAVEVFPFYGDITKIDASSEKFEGPALDLTATFRLTE